MTLVRRGAREVEEGIRRRLFAGVMRLAGRVDSPNISALRERPLAVLIIAEDALGDTILTVPAMRAVAEAHPGTVVDVVTWAGPAEVLRDAAFIRRLIVFPRRDRRRLAAWRVIRRHGPYDVVVDAMVFHEHVRSRSFAMMLGSGATYWIGERDRGSDYLLNVTRPRIPKTTPHIERMLSLVAPLTNGAIEPRPVLPLTDEELDQANGIWDQGPGAPRIMINVSTNGPERQWPADRLAHVARHIRDREPGARIVVVGLARDGHIIDRVAGAGRATRLDLGLREVMAVVAKSDLVVSPDTAICHLASAYMRPLVSIHNASQANFLPHDTPGVRIIGEPDAENLDDIPVERVLHGVDRTLAELRRTRGVAETPSRGSGATQLR